MRWEKILMRLMPNFNEIDAGGIGAVTRFDDMIEFFARTSSKISDSEALEYFDIIQARMDELEFDQNTRYAVMAAIVGFLEKESYGKGLLRLAQDYMAQHSPNDHRRKSCETSLAGRTCEESTPPPPAP